ncbi:PAS domain-containing protein [Sphingomonas sp. M1-B02]|uniref:PAS domain-containing protein n=1 Tax=Sphingomonas sp. M1-B02 TaxID=3114300 RepID=UPI00223FDC4C|nr:PAS domain-containing protein [Sphingomonas sp. S6-11]UZK67233.1 PAS domain-containing protein [Sphingomonas sp. S6-11]
MKCNLETADVLLSAALSAARLPADIRAGALESIAAPVYLTDASGRLTHYNAACISFAGRVPTPGEDRWCVTWRLYTTAGHPLPHEECPMAVAVRERREVRGMEALAERPDGSRVRFRPFPTPLYTEDGDFAGAVNVMIDVTDRRRAEDLRYQAARCRRLLTCTSDSQAIEALRALAAEYDAEAERLVATLN